MNADVDAGGNSCKVRVTCQRVTHAGKDVLKVTCLGQSCNGLGLHGSYKIKCK